MSFYYAKFYILKENINVENDREEIILHMIQKNNDNIINDRAVRDRCAGHYEVLEKVKDLLLLPGTELMSVNQVADYYEVTPEYIKAVYGSNRNEINSDGTTIISRDYYTDNGSKINITSVDRKQTSVTYTFEDGQSVTINNRGLKAFSKRAVLRIGMLLQQSEVAREVRTQLLNIEEKTSDDVKTEDINEEQRLMLNVGMAYASGSIEAVMKATTEYNAFQNRHIEKLKQDNKALAGNILEWKDRSKLNAGVRKLASVTGKNFSKVWNELYKNLQYKYGICLKQRGGQPYLQWIKEDEWDNVMKTFCAMCEAYEQSPSDMFQQKTPVDSLK